MGLDISNLIENLTVKLLLLTSSNLTGEISTDIADIYESSYKFIKFVDSIYSLNSADELETILIELDVELDHINWHRVNLKNNLKTLSLIP